VTVIGPGSREVIGKLLFQIQGVKAEARSAGASSRYRGFARDPALLTLTGASVDFGEAWWGASIGIGGALCSTIMRRRRIANDHPGRTVHGTVGI